MAGTRRQIFFAVIMGLSVLTTFCAVANSEECTIGYPSGVGCAGCRNTGFTFTKQIVVQIGVDENGNPIGQFLLVEFKVCKRCDNMGMDWTVGPYNGPPTNGKNPDATQSQEGCGAGSTLYATPIALDCVCDAGVAIPANSPDIASMQPGLKSCLLFVRSTVDLTDVTATKDCATGAALPPPMPPMP